MFFGAACISDGFALPFALEERKGAIGSDDYVATRAYDCIIRMIRSGSQIEDGVFDVDGCVKKHAGETNGCVLV